MGRCTYGRLAIAVLLAGGALRAQTVSLVSLGENWNVWQPSGIGFEPISDDGRFVLFTSRQALLPIDTNGTDDGYLRDCWLDVTTLVTVGSGGLLANGQNREPSLSGDGNVIAFHSLATNLASPDTNGDYDLFVHERSTGLTERINVGPLGVESNGMVGSKTSLSRDGSLAVFFSYATNMVTGDDNGVADVFLRDRGLQRTELLSAGPGGVPGNGHSYNPRTTGDGRFVVFSSFADNLGPLDTNAHGDIYLLDRSSGAMELVSVSSSGAQGNGDSIDSSVSADGRYVAFLTFATNLAPNDTNGASDVLVRDRLAGTTTRCSQSTSGVQSNSWGTAPVISADGRFVLFKSDASNLVPGDFNGLMDMFRRDVASGTTSRVSLNSQGQPLNRHINIYAASRDGRFLVMTTDANNVLPGVMSQLERVWVRDLTGLTPTRYCSPQVGSTGCAPRLDTRGHSSATSGGAFLVGVTQIEPQRAGLLFFGTRGPDSAPFHGGTLCVAPPLRRTRPQYSISVAPPPCGGQFAYDFNRLFNVPSDVTLKYGDRLWVQAWIRDSVLPGGAQLSDALELVIGP